MDNNRELYLKILKDTLKINPQKINDSDSAETIKRWNSMTHMKMFARLEKAFNIKFDINEVIQVKSIGDLKRTLSKYQIYLQ